YGVRERLSCLRLVCGFSYGVRELILFGHRRCVGNEREMYTRVARRRCSGNPQAWTLTADARSCLPLRLGLGSSWPGLADRSARRGFPSPGRVPIVGFATGIAHLSSV